jgi:AcrR family transcriptional regulator
MAKKLNKNLQKSINKNDLPEFLAHWPKLSSRKRAHSILLAAIANYASKGIENTTYDDIAKAAKISRPLIFSYFKDYEEIFYYVVKLIRSHFQDFAVAALKKQSSPTEMLSAYVTSTFQWLDQYPNHAGTLLLYLQRCARNSRDRDLNTQFHEAGQLRLAALIRLAEDKGQAKCKDPDSAARLIQTVIAGALVNSVSVTMSDKARFREQVLTLCLGVAGIKT